MNNTFFIIKIYAVWVFSHFCMLFTYAKNMAGKYHMYFLFLALQSVDYFFHHQERHNYNDVLY